MTTPLISTRTMVGLGKAIAVALGNKELRAAMDVSGLPDISLFTHCAYLPHLGQLTFLAEATRRSEGRLPQILASQLRVSDYGAFGGYVTGGKTFGAALARTGTGIPWHTSHDRTSLSRRGDAVRLTYTSHVRHAFGYSSYAPLAAFVMQSIAAPYFGYNSVSQLVRIDAPRQGALSEWERLFGCEVRFDCDSLSLDFDIDLLSRPRFDPRPTTTTIEDVVRESSRQAPQDFVGVTEQLIRLAVLDGVVRLDAVAAQLRLGPRTFRRRLETEGLTFRKLVAQHRASRATELLGDGAFTVREIALSLGYSDTAHFIRAFKRETGRTPGEMLNVS
ncbi:helix-turn-helix domain-containing protein [Ruegeria pomeroyi]|nr:helix-turn-helix domain-containing protein [Ruegeria pomeroyi]